MNDEMIAWAISQRESGQSYTRIGKALHIESSTVKRVIFNAKPDLEVRPLVYTGSFECDEIYYGGNY